MSDFVPDRLTQHRSTVTPGLPVHIGAQHVGAPESVAQGDLYLRVNAADMKIPPGFSLIKNPSDKDRQLAIEAGVGSHHRLQSLDGVSLYHPENWGKDESLIGPIVVFERPNAIVHEPGHDKPHGAVHIDVPCAIEIRYQKNLDAITRREIRARD